MRHTDSGGITSVFLLLLAAAIVGFGVVGYFPEVSSWIHDTATYALQVLGSGLAVVAIVVGAIAWLIWRGFGAFFRHWNWWLGTLAFLVSIWGMLALFYPEQGPLSDVSLGGMAGQKILLYPDIRGLLRLAGLTFLGFLLVTPRGTARFFWTITRGVGIALKGSRSALHNQGTTTTAPVQRVGFEGPQATRTEQMKAPAVAEAETAPQQPSVAPKHDKGTVRGLLRRVALGHRTPKDEMAGVQDGKDALQSNLAQMVKAVSAMSEKRDPATADHARRVTQLVDALSQELGLPEVQAQAIHVAAQVHDIGKISAPSEILNRPGKLTEQEQAIIRTHPQAAYDALKEISFPRLIADIVLQHHERLDGSGYPNSLTGENIIEGARVLSVADVVEAMSSHRPYRAALTIEQAMEEISRDKGMLYDPRVVEACLNLFARKGFTFR
ncbi:MAG: HD domain-containing protein [Chloroflexi bacterium]|nr:HD domain-containing protein [Chloroflexota bacterium]